MLVKVIVENFKCFKRRTVFDFQKTNYKFLEKNTSGKMLKGVLFVGDNASGKTTALEPVTLLLSSLFRDMDEQLFLYHCLFSKEQKTYIKYEFDIDGHAVEYSFLIKKGVFSEEILELDRKRYIERKDEDVTLAVTEQPLHYEVDGSILFLKKWYFNTKFDGNPVLLRWFDFLQRSVYINAYLREVFTFNGESLVMKKYLEKYGVEEINHFFKENGFSYSIQYTKKIKRGKIQYEMAENQEKMIFFEREDVDVPIPLFLESVGNQTLINILPAILHSVQQGGMLLIDEFSSGFHNKLEELLVRYIMENSRGVQVFFVSHSTNLLSNALLRPDQIYAVEFLGNEGSVIKRFSDEQPRAAQNLEKMYLSGVFGGIPEYGTEEK